MRRQPRTAQEGLTTTKDAPREEAAHVQNNAESSNVPEHRDLDAEPAVVPKCAEGLDVPQHRQGSDNHLEYGEATASREHAEWPGGPNVAQFLDAQEHAKLLDVQEHAEIPFVQAHAEFSDVPECAPSPDALSCADAWIKALKPCNEAELELVLDAVAYSRMRDDTAPHDGGPDPDQN